MRYITDPCTKALLFVCLLISTMAQAGAAEFHNALSLQGFTGILNTPNAHVTEEGKLYALYSNQEEIEWRSKARSQDNYMISIGLFDRFEAGGRFVEAPGAARDLSFNGKLRIPFIPTDSFLPQLAVGVQDISGGKNANMLKTYYAVASQELWRLRFSLGYGTGPDRMDGLFGGAELKTCDWFYLLADYDTKETNVGARVVTPHLFGYPLNLQLTAKTSLDHNPGNIELAVGLQLPLGLEHHGSAPIPAVAVQSQPLPPPTGVPAPEAGSDSRHIPLPVNGGVNADSSDPQLRLLLQKLANQGFLNLRVGTKGEMLVVEFENSRFNQNELDAFGVVAGTALRHMPTDCKEVRLISRKKNLVILQLTAPAQELRDFYLDAATEGKLQGKLHISEEVANDGDVVYIKGEENSSVLNSSLVLYPGLKTYLGTEIAAFDYLLSLKADLFVDTWKGGVINAGWDLPLLWSENFDNGKYFGDERDDSRMDRLMLFQALRPTPGLMAILGAGMVVHDTYGTVNEAIWSPGMGAHRFRLMQAYGEDRDHRKNESYLGGYRYYHAPLDTSLEATVGRFWTEDTGFMLELKRFFGDTAVIFYYKNSEATDNKNHQAVGVQFSLPLTPRQDMKPKPVQVRGSEEWSYSEESEIAKNGSWNYIGTTIGTKPETPFNIGRVFYNRDRLNEGYIRKHLLRMRDAYVKYGDDQL